VNSDLTQHSSHRATGNSDARTTEGYIRGTEMSKQSVFKEQSYESVVKWQFAESVLGESFEV
jgi:hypothetical protein